MAAGCSWGSLGWGGDVCGDGVSRNDAGSIIGLLRARRIVVVQTFALYKRGFHHKGFSTIWIFWM